METGLAVINLMNESTVAYQSAECPISIRKFFQKISRTITAFLVSVTLLCSPENGILYDVTLVQVVMAPFIFFQLP